MRRQILANLTILAFVTGTTTDAMAFDHKASHGSHVRHFHAGGTHSFGPPGAVTDLPGSAAPMTPVALSTSAPSG